MNLIRKHYGTIELGKSVILSDPCYEPDIWCSAQVNNMIPGIYDCYADFTEIEHWGTRVTRLVIMIDNPPHEAPKKVKEVSACLAVDAGVFGIYDEKYFRKKKSENPDAWYERNVLSWVMKEEGFICEDAKGFITTSGFGDGCYNAYCHLDDHGKVYKIEVVFIVPEDDDSQSMEIKEFVDNETSISEIQTLLKEESHA